MRNRFLDAFFLTLTIIGSLYLGMVGFFGVDIFSMFLGALPLFFTRVLFGLIGIAGIYAFTLYGKLDDEIQVHKY